MIENVIIHRGSEDFVIIVDPSSSSLQALRCDLSRFEHGGELGGLIAAFSVLCMRGAERQPDLASALSNAQLLARSALFELARAVAPAAPAVEGVENSPRHLPDTGCQAGAA